MEPEDLRAAAGAWAAADPDPTTRRAVEEALAADDRDELVAAFGTPLVFGTAGLRGPVGAGPARMNLAVVRRTTWALAQHLATTAAPDAPVCVGFDARPDSRRFALDVAGVLLAAGRPVVLWKDPTPTPLVAWSARVTDAAAAVVITASHNPPADNGYKLYGPDAIQIVPPTDARIEALTADAPPATAIPVVEDVWAHPLLEDVGRFARRRYLDDVVALVAHDAPRASVRVVHTAMHGVGGAVVLEGLRRAGVRDVHVVAAQQEPDGTFPTVAFPNPEEPGALDLAFAVATEVGADVVVANDPDADRLAVGVPDGTGWRRLSGNEVGVLLADDLLRRAPDRALVCASIVSSPWLGVVAAHHGARFEQTLTGFKWIWHAASALEAEGWTPVLGAEEALGYAVGVCVRDKDGISAALVLVDLARRLAAAGSTLAERLAALRARDGAWVAAQVSAVRAGAHGRVEIAEAMARARTAPPTSLAGLPVTGVRDLGSGGAGRPPWLPDSDLVEYLVPGGRALVRPSGTEPKCKAYVDLVAADGDVVAGHATAAAVGRALLAHVGLG